MDCNMPIMDGYESCNKIRSYLKSLDLAQPLILAVTGHTEQNYVERAINCGMNLVLSKPINADVLKEILIKINFEIEDDIEPKNFKDLKQMLSNKSKLS